MKSNLFQTNKHPIVCGWIYNDEGKMTVRWRNPVRETMGRWWWWLVMEKKVSRERARV
jgi:hypothetical protein